MVTLVSTNRILMYFYSTVVMFITLCRYAIAVRAASTRRLAVA